MDLGADSYLPQPRVRWHDATGRTVLARQEEGTRTLRQFLSRTASEIRFEIGGPEGIPRAGYGRPNWRGLPSLRDTSAPLLYPRRRQGRPDGRPAHGDRGRGEASTILRLAQLRSTKKQQMFPVRTNIPDAELPEQALGFRVQGYGMRTWADLFTNRQLIALTTLSDLIADTHARVVADGGDRGYADAVATYLSFALSKVTDNLSNLCAWRPDAIKEGLNHVFARQALSMVWEYAEGNIFNDGPCDISTGADWIAKALMGLPASVVGSAEQADAAALKYNQAVISTDPPYYDNVGYSDLADYFYVWLRRSLGALYPALLGTMLTPKTDELVANPFRHDDANKFFENGFSEVFRRICEGTSTSYPMTVYYAFKQAETNADGDHASTGWETLLEGLLSAGWSVTGTWPIRTELGNRMRSIDSNALASSIVLACRPRPEDAGFTDRRGLINALRDELPEALRKLEQSKVAPVDLRQAAIGPGMAVFSRYARVNEPDGSAMRVRAALALINQVVDERLSQLEGNVSPDTRFCVEWFKQHGFDEGLYGTAETLSKGIDTSITGLERGGVLKQRGGEGETDDPFRRFLFFMIRWKMSGPRSGRSACTWPSAEGAGSERGGAADGSGPRGSGDRP